MVNTRLFSISICAGFLTALCGEVPADTGKDYPPILVEAFGFGIPKSGKPESQLREEAIKDALKNAEMQALVSVNMEIHIEDLRIKERRLHLSSLGSAKLVRILQTDYVTNSPLYRVRVEAQVLQLQNNPLNSEIVVELDQSQPKIILIIQSKTDPGFGNRLQQIFTEQLLNSGVDLVSSSTDPEAVILNISLVQLGSSSIELQWNMGKQSTSVFSTKRIIGNRLVSHTDQLPTELKNLGTWLAHEASQFTSL